MCDYPRLLLKRLEKIPVLGSSNSPPKLFWLTAIHSVRNIFRYNILNLWNIKIFLVPTITSIYNIVHRNKMRCDWQVKLTSYISSTFMKNKVQRSILTISEGLLDFEKFTIDITKNQRSNISNPLKKTVEILFIKSQAFSRVQIKKS